jgi:hypothetical protein
MKRVRDMATTAIRYQPCGLLAQTWLDEIVGRHLADCKIFAPAMLRLVCYWFAVKIRPAQPPCDGAAYTAEMQAIIACGRKPPLRLGIRLTYYPWYHSRCPVCGTVRKSVEGTMVTCYAGHSWENPMARFTW